jgi:hypothetical protein
VGSADPWSAPFAPPFIWVTARWVPRSVPDVWVSWRRFARVVGPWILMLNTWQCLIHQEVLILDWWGVMDTWDPVCQHVATWPDVGPTGPTWCDVHISLIRPPMYANDISVSIASTSPSQWCKPIWHLSMPLVYFLSTISFHAYFDVSCNKRWKHQHLWKLSV